MARTRLTAGATPPSGLYGSTKAIQRAAEAATRKLTRQANRIARRLWAKDEGVVAFLQMHAKREGSKSARVLLAALKELGPKISEEVFASSKKAAQVEYGLYGYKSKTAELGLAACHEVRTAAGRITADLHRRKADAYTSLTGFFKEHSKQARCVYSGLLLSCYPEEGTKFAGSALPLMVDRTPVAVDTHRGTTEVYASVVDASNQIRGYVRNMELLPSDFSEFRSAMVRLAGDKAESLRLLACSCTSVVPSAIPTLDGVIDVEGVAVVQASWDGSEPVHTQLAFTAEYTALPKAGDKTILASGDWIEWED